jgi:transcriptional regulator with XRE-family HTH domain
LLIDNLKLHLKAQGLRQRDIADRLGVGLATVKRWLSGEGLTTRRLEDLCDLAKIELFELVEMTARSHSGKATALPPRRNGRWARTAPVLHLLLAAERLAARGVRARVADLAADHAGMSCSAGAAWPDRCAERRAHSCADHTHGVMAQGRAGAKHFEARQSFVDVENAEDALTMSDFVRLTDAGGRSGAAADRGIAPRNPPHRPGRPPRPELERTWYGVLFFARPLNMPAISNSISESV